MLRPSNDALSTPTRPSHPPRQHACLRPAARLPPLLFSTSRRCTLTVWCRGWRRGTRGGPPEGVADDCSREAQRLSPGPARGAATPVPAALARAGQRSHRPAWTLRDPKKRRQRAISPLWRTLLSASAARECGASQRPCWSHWSGLIERC